jgi:dienelactone hydrolase
MRELTPYPPFPESTPETFPARGFCEPGVTGIFYEGAPYRGNPTRVFAWIGLPELFDKPVPAMVLVHGGGGTAFADWVRLWNRRGYAAIAMDTCGCTAGGEDQNRPRHPMGGPPGWGGWDQIDDPVEDQWLYHAVQAVLRARLLLEADGRVDSARIGLTGISWGGIIACIAAGLDSRFRFTVPVYGCGYLADNELLPSKSLNELTPAQRERWLATWDPSHYLPRATMPFLWLNGTNDIAFTLPVFCRSAAASGGSSTLCLRPDMEHSHGTVSEHPEEIHTFANQHCRGGIPLATCGSTRWSNGTATADCASETALVEATLVCTRDAGPWIDRHWQSIPARMESGGKGTTRALASLPGDATAWFINFVDDRGLLVSSPLSMLPVQS